MTDDIELRAAVDALKRLARVEEMAGGGDVQDPEGLARVDYARRALASIGYSHKVKERR
jgi:hypothetical protein